MIRLGFAALLLLAACDRAPAPVSPNSAGAMLERTAITSGAVADPDKVVPTGVYQAGTDRVCILPSGDAYRIGASVDYDEGQNCTARGTATGNATLKVDFGGDCQFDATIDGERLSFPAVVPEACERLCKGRSSLAALQADLLSSAASEAMRVTAADDTPLCAGS